MTNEDPDPVERLRHRVRQAREAHRQAVAEYRVEDMTLTGALDDLALVLSDPDPATQAVARALLGEEVTR